MNDPTRTTPGASRLAAALRYDTLRDQAPTVVAAGKGLIAEEIIRRAIEAGVPRVESEALAAALTKVDIDDAIPPELYLAVAEVLAWVYRIEGDLHRGQTPSAVRG